MPVEPKLVAVEEAEEAKPERQWPVVVTLRHPVDFGSEHIAKLEFRRGKMGDLKGMRLSETVPAEQLISIASRLCGQPVKVIEMLDVDDAGEVMELVLDFFSKCLTATKKSSR